MDPFFFCLNAWTNSNDSIFSQSLLHHAMGFIKERLSDLAGYLKPHERQMATSDPDAVLPNGKNMDRHHY